MKKKSAGDVIFDAVVYFFVTLALIITLYPFIYVLSMSVSNPEAVVKNEVFLFPVGFSLDAFSFLKGNADILHYYYNTIWYTVVGTTLNVIFTIMAAYPLSKKDFVARKFLTFVYVFTMFFNGGMIPNYLLIVNLGLFNTRWAMIFPGLIGVMNLIICRTFFQSLSEELFESARLEGCTETKVIWHIVIPLSKPIIAVLTLFYAVGHWNSFFHALMYLSKASLHPIQIFLRRVLIMSSPELAAQSDVSQSLVFLQIKYAVVMVTILPIVTLYPFLQKYFVKGVMIGSLKG